MQSRGEPEIAEQIMQQAIHTPAPAITIRTALPQTAGVSTRENWKWRPVGGDTPQARARALALLPRDFLEISEVKLNAYARAHKGGAKLPGIEFYDAGSVTVRG
jgi:hypothetical protein